MTMGRVLPLRSRERGTWILTDEREGVLGGALHPVAVALCQTPKVRTWMSRQEGKGRATASVWILWMTDCPLWTGALTRVPLGAELLVTSPSTAVLGWSQVPPQGYAGGRVVVSTQREWVCVWVCPFTLLRAWCYA